MDKVGDYLVSCDTCKKGYLRKESMKEPCMYCVGHSHFERKAIMTLYRCMYIVLYGYEDGRKLTIEDWIEVEAEVKPTKQEVIDTLEGNNLLPKLLLNVDVYSISSIPYPRKG